MVIATSKNKLRAATTWPFPSSGQTTIKKSTAARGILKADGNGRESPDIAASIMELLCPSPRDRMLILRQLIRSIEAVDKIAQGIWALTLFDNGFRLNVGPVEAMTFHALTLGDISLLRLRLLFHGEIGKEFQKFVNKNENVHGIYPMNYKSVPQPQYVYMVLGDVTDGTFAPEVYEQVEKGLEYVFPLHVDFIDNAARTSTGKIRKASNYSPSHSQGLCIYAQSFVGGQTVATDDHAKLTIQTKSESEEMVWHFQEELPADEPLFEGARRVVQVNAFERNSKVRQKCIAHYGTSCSVCGFNFGSTYAGSADDYIHVHHLKPLASIGEEYAIDPIKDMRPVCANCHAVIHLRQPPYSIKEMKEMLNVDAHKNKGETHAK